MLVPVVHEPPSSQCGQSDYQQLMERLKMIHQQLPPAGCNPPLTCKLTFFAATHLPPQATTRSMQAANGSVVQVYCDMDCGGE